MALPTQTQQVVLQAAPNSAVLQQQPVSGQGPTRQVAIQLQQDPKAPPGSAPAGILTGVAGVAGNSKANTATAVAPQGSVVQNNQILMARQKRKQSLK